MNNNISTYSHTEEKINVWSHLVGVILGIIATIFLGIKETHTASWIPRFAYILYGASLIILFSASTLYHNSKNSKKRSKLKVFDHSAIYCLIAGSYTPYSLIGLGGAIGWWIFATAWSIAIIGVIYKMKFTGKYPAISTISYVAMGWIAVFAAKPFIQNLQKEALFWLVIGGVLYSTGAIFYSIKKIPMNHVIFHIFVLFGAFSHFISIYFYL